MYGTQEVFEANLAGPLPVWASPPAEENEVWQK